jgi:hypothetical protein
VLCVTSATGAKTLPVFSDRKAARRFLRASPLWFDLLGSGWRTWRIEESGSLLVDPPMASRGSRSIRLPRPFLGSVEQNRWHG